MKKITIALILIISFVYRVKSQDRLTINGKIDFASDYIWRGTYQNSGFSVQSALGLSYRNLALTAWGSQSLTKTDGAQELDLTLGYTLGHFGITLTDYWWNGIASPYGDYRHDHHFEAAISYKVSEKIPLTLGWATIFAGGDDNQEGERAFSTYISLSYYFNCPAAIVLTPALGFTPWKGMYDAEGANITDISLKAGKDIKISDHFCLSLWVQAIAAPAYDKAYLIAGFGIGF